VYESVMEILIHETATLGKCVHLNHELWKIYPHVG